MFVLRKISQRCDNIEINIALGDSYTWISKEINPNEFKRVTRSYNGFDSDDNTADDMPNGDLQALAIDDSIIGFISNHDGSELLTISNYQDSFIMTESGKTFSRVGRRSNFYSKNK